MLQVVGIALDVLPFHSTVSLLLGCGTGCKRELNCFCCLQYFAYPLQCWFLQQSKQAVLCYYAEEMELSCMLAPTGDAVETTKQQPVRRRFWLG